MTEFGVSHGRWSSSLLSSWNISRLLTSKHALRKLVHTFNLTRLHYYNRNFLRAAGLYHLLGFIFNPVFCKHFVLPLCVKYALWICFHAFCIRHKLITLCISADSTFLSVSGYLFFDAMGLFILAAHAQSHDWTAQTLRLLDCCGSVVIFWDGQNQFGSAVFSCMKIFLHCIKALTHHSVSR